MDIINIKRAVKSLQDEDRKLFKRFFSLNVVTGRMHIPDSMKGWIKRQFGSVKKVEKQRIVKIMNRFTFEGTLFNSLRAERPMEVRSDEDIQKMIEETVGDPFDTPDTKTPEDIFGRVKGRFTESASNIAKYDAMHEVLIFSRHNPLFLKSEELKDHVDTAKEWFKKAFVSSRRKAKYPFLMWNALYKSGASIVHGHMQSLLSEKTHYAKAELLHKVWKKYKSKGDYFEDWFRIHKSLGLGKVFEGVKVFVNLTPIKEKEIVIIAEELNNAFSSALFKCIQFYINKVGVQSFNVGVILPPMDDSWPGFPVIARIVDRGPLSIKTTDIGAMELYAGNSVVSSDPFKLFAELSKNL